MNRTVSRYLEKRAQLERWPLQTAPQDPPRCVVVIPALDEYPGLFDTLSDLQRCPGVDDTLVIVVVNNRVDTSEVEANRLTLQTLRAEARRHVAFIDASSAGHELPAGEGVGLARKIGLDWGLHLLTHHGDDREGREQAPLVCLDADTRVDDDYLSAIHRFFTADEARWGAVLPYAHPIEGNPEQQAAILNYELYLRYHALHLRWAGSPYAYHTIGSTIACTAHAYAAVSGMNRRQAGEDFYFLQQLAKTGRVETLPGTVVRPSARVSDRVPFGTGRRVQRFLDGDTESRLTDPRSYDVLRLWLDAINTGTECDGQQMLDAAAAIHDELRAFLVAQKLAPTWDRLRSQAATPDALRQQAHRWFDGLRATQLLHRLRDTTWPDVPSAGAIAQLLRRLGQAAVVDLSSQLDLTAGRQTLTQLRQLS